MSPLLVQRWLLAGLFVVSVLAFPAPSAADTLSFECADSGLLCEGFSRSYWADVLASGSGVSFTVYNDGPAMFPLAYGGSITDVYFDAPTGLFTDAAVSSSAGVSFGGNGTGQAAGAPSPAFADYSFGAPSLLSGVGPGEWLRISFGLTSGSTLGTVLGSLSTGSTRVGLQVRGLSLLFPLFVATGTYVSEVPSSTAPVPEPASLLLLGSGLAAVAGYARRRRRKGAL